MTDSQNSDAEVPDTVTENTRYTVTCGGPSDNLPALLPVSVPTLAPSAATPTKLPSLSPTVAPTVSPSRLTLIIKPPPSTAPTAPPFSSLLEFEVFQEINGISSQEFLSEEELYSTVLRYAIADCMDGVETNNIVDMTVEDGGNFTSFVSSFVATTSNSLRLRSLSKSENRLLTEELLSHEPASGLLAQSKMHTLVNGARINLFYVVSVGSSSLTFQSLTAQLLQAVADGRFNLFLHSHAAAFGALRLMNATAGAITTASAPQSLQEINLDATRKDLLLVQEPISYIPGAIVFVIGLAALLIRNPINKELNPLYSNYLELLDLLLRVGNIVLCFYVLNWMPNIGINIATAVLLLSRILVLVIWGNFSMTYICRSSRSRARLLKLIYTQARDHQWYHYVYFMLYISSMFEMTLLRYLPWTRHAAVSGPLQGYPSTYFYNTCTYMSLVATIMQVVACSLSLFVYSTQEMIENEYFSLLLLFVLSCAQTVRLLLSLFAYCTMPTPERERIREEEAYALDDLYSEASSEASSKTSYSNSNSYFSNGYFNNPMGESTRLNSDDTSSIGSSRIYGTNRKSFLRSRDEESMYDGTSEYSNDGAKLLSERSSAGKKSRYLQPRSQKSEMDNLFDLSFIRGTSFFGGASEYTNDNRSVSELSGTTWSSRKKNNRLQALRHLDDDDDEDEINDNQLLDFSIYHTKDGDLTLLGIPSCPLKKENNLCCSFEREDSALSLRLPSRPASSEMISRTGSFHELVRSNSNILRLQSPISPRGYLNGKPTNSTILKTSFNDINTDNIDAGRNYSADKYEQNEFAHTNPLTIPRDNTSSLRLSNCNMNDLNNNNYLNYKNYTSGSNSNNNSRPNSAGRRRPDHDNSKRNSASFSKN